MIGQKNLQSTLQELVSNNRIPRFVIIEGPARSGKKTLADWLVKQFDDFTVYRLPDVKIDTIRAMIQDAYTTKNNMVVLITDADKMSLAAKNSLLKIVEEPPNNIYFVLTAVDSDMLLMTIKSRAVIYRMENYAENELKQYASQYKADATKEEIKTACKVCRNPGEVQMFFDYGALSFIEFVDKVIDNISEAPLFNAMKIASHISMKEGSEGYDLEFFWEIFVYRCLGKAFQQEVLWNAYSIYMRITLNHLKELHITGINKQMMFDKWLIELQEVSV